MARTHRFRFFRVGGFDQVLLDRPEDLLHLDQLDPKLWVALGCPVKGLEFDEETLRRIDSDGDGRLRVPEILAAVKWATSVLVDPRRLIEGGDELPLAAIDAEHPEGQKILASARQILADLGQPDAGSICLAQVAETAKLYANTRFNGDGIVPASSADDEATAGAIEAIVASMGGEADRSGKPGVSKAGLEAFFKEAEAYDAWMKQAESDAATVLPLGADTARAAEALEAVQAKVDDWFTRCRLAAFDARAAAPLNRSEEEYVAVAGTVLSPQGDEVASFPLARVVAGGALPLVEGINPAWADRIEALRRLVVEPLLGARTELTADDWKQVVAALAPYRKWAASPGGKPLHGLGIERVRELISSGAREKILALIERDLALQPALEGIEQVERLIRYQRDLHRLLVNFVSFGDFYSKKKAIFQAGTLYLDRRGFELTLRVDDPGAHAAIAAQSKTYLLYCDCVRRSDGKKMSIVAAVTDGDSTQLAVGRNGIFYDRRGADWDATITKIVENPISIREAFWTPYRRIGKLVGEQLERFASTRDSEIHSRAAAGIENGVAAPPAGTKEQAFDVAKFAGVFAAIGLALGAIGSAFAALATGFLSLTWWQMPLALLGAILLISGPSMLMAWLKLRQRTLGPILDASGWAVNSSARINIPFGASLTAVARLPRGAELNLTDPYAPPRRGWAVAAVLLVVVAGLVALALYTGAGEQLIGAISE